jgi:hypothetical protein
MLSEMRSRVALIDNKADLVSFIEALRDDLRASPKDWENATPESYLSALASWVEDSDAYYKNHGQAPPASPSWRSVGEMLLAAKMYE